MISSSLGLKQRSISNSSNLGRSCNHDRQRSWNFSGIGSSQSSFIRHKSCRIRFAWRMNGQTNPNGSNTELTTDSSPLLVMGRSLMTMLNPNWSVETFHWTPKTLSIDKLSKLRSLIFSALSDSGKDLISLCDVEFHLVNLKPPLDSNSRN